MLATEGKEWCSPVHHIEENTWDFPQTKDDTEGQNAGSSYQNSHNLDL